MTALEDMLDWVFVCSPFTFAKKKKKNFKLLHCFVNLVNLSISESVGINAAVFPGHFTLLKLAIFH